MTSQAYHLKGERFEAILGKSEIGDKASRLSDLVGKTSTEALEYLLPHMDTYWNRVDVEEVKFAMTKELRCRAIGETRP